MPKHTYAINPPTYQDVQDIIMKLSDDGFIRMGFDQLMSVSLSHLISINEESNFIEPYTKIFGYTEWISQTTPVVSIGWDWKMNHDDRVIQLMRIGLPRSNLMLMDYLHCDVGLEQTLHLICQKIDSTAWEMIVKDQILNTLTSDHMTLSYS